MSKTIWMLLLIFCLGLPMCVISGCVVRSNGEPLITIEVEKEPPEPRYEERPPVPGSHYVWEEGHWYWDGHDWEWRQGHWKRVKHGYSRWVGGYWTQRGKRWVWVEGHWE